MRGFLKNYTVTVAKYMSGDMVNSKGELRHRVLPKTEKQRNEKRTFIKTNYGPRLLNAKGTNVLVPLTRGQTIKNRANADPKQQVDPLRKASNQTALQLAADKGKADKHKEDILKPVKSMSIVRSKVDTKHIQSLQKDLITTTMRLTDAEDYTN